MGYTNIMLKYSASCILYSLVFVVTLATGAAGSGVQQWFPERKDLEIISMRNAILVNGIALIIVGVLTYVIIRAIRP